MLQKLEDLVFYFIIECAICHNEMHTSHVVVEEQNGVIICSLCGKEVRIPHHERLANSARELNEYLGDATNAQYIKLHKNPKFVTTDDVPAAGH